MRVGSGRGTDWVGVAATAVVVQTRRSRWSLEMGPKFAAGCVGLCDAGMAAGSDCGSGSVDGGGGGAVAVAAAGGAAASAGAAAGAGVVS